MLKLNLKAPQYPPLTEYELWFVGKEVRYLLTQQGAVDLRSRCAVWQSDWPPTTRERDDGQPAPGGSRPAGRRPLRALGGHPMMVCVGCGQSIDLAFDSVLRDEAERPWHATCRTKRLGRQDVNVNPNAELAAATFSPTLWVGAKLIDGWRARRSSVRRIPSVVAPVHRRSLVDGGGNSA